MWQLRPKCTIQNEVRRGFWNTFLELNRIGRDRGLVLTNEQYEYYCRLIYEHLMKLLETEGYQRVGFDEHLAMAKKMENCFSLS